MRTVAGSDPDSPRPTPAGLGFDSLYGIVVAGDILYVANRATDCLYRVVVATGAVTVLAGGKEGYADGTGTAARFSLPAGMVMDSTGTLYVADAANHCIWMVK